jgi:hypothetical protein
LYIQPSFCSDQYPSSYKSCGTSHLLQPTVDYSFDHRNTFSNMAKSGDKRRLAENAAHLKKLGILIAGANAVYIVVRLLLRRRTAAPWNYWALGGTTLLYGICYSAISNALAPHYSPTGELIYAGADLAVGGALSYYHDVVYLALFCQVFGAATNWAWVAMAAIPAYALYMLSVKVVGPMLLGAGGGGGGGGGIAEQTETEAERRRREKRERQAARAEKFAQRR